MSEDNKVDLSVEFAGNNPTMMTTKGYAYSNTSQHQQGKALGKAPTLASKPVSSSDR